MDEAIAEANKEAESKRFENQESLITNMTLAKAMTIKDQRREIAIAAMQGMLSADVHNNLSHETISMHSVEQADSLIAELDK